MKGGEGFIALGGALAGIGAVERGHERIGLGTDDKPVHGAAVALGIGGIEFVIFVVRRVSGLLEHKQIKAGTAECFVERTAGGEDGITEFFSFQAPPVHPPERAVIGVDFFKIRIGR